MPAPRTPLSLLDLPEELLGEILRHASAATLLALCHSSSRCRRSCPPLHTVDALRTPCAVLVSGLPPPQRLVVLGRANAIAVASTGSAERLLRDVAERGRARALSRSHPFAELLSALALAYLRESGAAPEVPLLWEAAWERLTRGFGPHTSRPTFAGAARWIALAHTGGAVVQDELVLLWMEPSDDAAVAAAEDGALVALTQAYRRRVAVARPAFELDVYRRRRIRLLYCFVDVSHAAFGTRALSLSLSLTLTVASASTTASST
jgi:hypothetical protein